MEKFGNSTPQDGSEKDSTNINRRGFLKRLGLLAGGVAILGTNAFSQTEQGQEQKGIENPRFEKMPDHNLPAGFDRKHVYAEINGVKTNVATAFFFEQGSTQARFISNDNHPECFSPEINYQKVQEIFKKEGKELVVAFPGAYRSPSGNIEGRAYENGKSVGEDTYSKWHGFTYISKNGNIELYRAKDSQGNFDQTMADTIISRAQMEKGSVYQQIPAIWNGEQKFKPAKPDLYEMRAICESKNGKKFMINCTEKITQDAFLKMCLALKDENGSPAVYNLMLTDTGECSLGVFRDKNQIANDANTGGFTKYPMVDERFAGNKNGFTNVVVVTK